MISDEDRAILQFLGFGILSNLAGFTMSTMLYGMFVVLFTHTTATFVQKRSKPRAAWAMFGLTTLSFVLATLYWSAFCVYFLGYVRLGYVGNINDLLGNYWWNDIFRSVFIPYEIPLCALQVLQMINDTIMIWRAWVLWNGQRSLMGGPVVLLLGMFGTLFAYLVITGSKQSSGHDFLKGVPLTLVISGACLSVATNVFSIILIGLRCRVHHKAWSLVKGSRLSSPSENILFLIMESGCIYCALQLVVLIISASTFQDKSHFTTVFAPIIFEFYVQTTAMYPMVVLLLINMKRSVVDIRVAQISVSYN